jgi:2-C-methyl-D-erythritol 4-phosphate cytidylyltransferase
MRVTAAIPAAGWGERMAMDQKKPYLLLNGRPLLFYVLDAFYNSTEIDNIIVAVAPGEEDFCRKKVVEKFSFLDKVRVIPGGATRQDSVRQLLNKLSAQSSMVLIHDGARPLITRELINRAIEDTTRWKATVMAVPVADTIKLANSDIYVEQTLPRDKLWAIQTPQTFDKNLICEAHARAYQDGYIGTDDASLVERMGISVKIIMGAYDNIKVTTPGDLIIAEALLKRREIQNSKT